MPFFQRFSFLIGFIYICSCQFLCTDAFFFCSCLLSYVLLENLLASPIPNTGHHRIHDYIQAIMAYSDKGEHLIELACNNTLNVSNHCGGYSVLGRLELLEKEPLDLENVLNEGSGIMRLDNYLGLLIKMRPNIEVDCFKTKRGLVSSQLHS